MHPAHRGPCRQLAAKPDEAADSTVRSSLLACSLLAPLCLDNPLTSGVKSSGFVPLE